MTIKGIRAGLVAAVQSAQIMVGGEALTCYTKLPNAVTAPCFYTGEVEIDPNVDYSTQTDNYTFVCRVLTSTGDDAAGQENLDDLLERAGPTSVRAAINAAAGEPGDYALNGACDDLKIVSVQGYREYTVGLANYYGAEIRVFTTGAGSG